jgi:hypothetical protein
MVDRDVLIEKIYDILSTYNMSGDIEYDDGSLSGEIVSEATIRIVDALIPLIEDKNA